MMRLLRFVRDYAATPYPALVAPAVTAAPEPIIRLEDDGRLDEFVARNVTIHFEAMGESQFWIGVNHPDGRMWHINCGAVNTRAKGYAMVEEDA